MSRSAVSTCDVSATSTTESNSDISATPAVSQESTSDVSATSPTSASAAPSPAERKVLRIAQRATGELGGGGAGGPIYGELTPRSMGKVIDALAACCGLDARALLLDVGAGRGLPSLVAAQRAGCASLGVECEEERWAQSIHNLAAVHDAASSDAEPELNTAVAFVRGDVARATTLDPCTHVYMFDTGFPAATLARLAELFNASSTARALVTFQPAARVARYGFAGLALRAQLAVKMAGSNEARTARVYARVAPPPPPAEPRPAEPMWAGALALLRDGSAERRRHDALRQRAEYTRRRSCATPDAARRRGARACERCRSTHGSMFHVFVAGARVLICAGCQDVQDGHARETAAPSKTGSKKRRRVADARPVSQCASAAASGAPSTRPSVAASAPPTMRPTVAPSGDRSDGVPAYVDQIVRDIHRRETTIPYATDESEEPEYVSGMSDFDEADYS